MIAFTVPTKLAGYGAANGYVGIPKGHAMYEMDYDSIPVEVHGGLTYADHYNERWHPKEAEGMWIVGFDTCHYGDTLSLWPTEKVLEEAERLKAQLETL